MNLEDYFRTPSLVEINESVEKLDDDLSIGNHVKLSELMDGTWRKSKNHKKH